MQVHPNIDKKLFLQNSIIAIKQEGKPYLLGEKVTHLSFLERTLAQELLFVSDLDGSVKVEVR